MQIWLAYPHITETEHSSTDTRSSLLKAWPRLASEVLPSPLPFYPRSLHSWWPLLIRSSADSKCLIILPFNLHFVNEIQWDVVCSQTEEIQQHIYLPIPWNSFKCGVWGTCKHWVPVGPSGGIQQKDSSKFKVTGLSPWLSKSECQQPQETTRSFVHGYFGNINLRNTNYQGTTSSYLSLHHITSLCSSATYAKNDNVEGKGKTELGQPIVLPAFV